MVIDEDLGKRSIQEEEKMEIDIQNHSVEDD